MVLSNRDVSKISGMLERLIIRNKFNLEFVSIDAVCECGHYLNEHNDVGCCKEWDDMCDILCGCGEFKIDSILLGVEEKEKVRVRV